MYSHQDWKITEWVTGGRGREARAAEYCRTEPREECQVSPDRQASCNADVKRELQRSRTVILWSTQDTSCCLSPCTSMLLGRSTSSHTPGHPAAEHAEGSEAAGEQRHRTGCQNPSSLDPAPLKIRNRWEDRVVRRWGACWALGVFRTYSIL